MTDLLHLQVRRKSFAGRTVLQDVALALREGEFVALVGASGCGKSTLLRIAAGLDRGFDGRVALAGRAVAQPTREIRFVFQEPRLFPWLSVARNVAFDLGGPAPDAARVAALLAEVGLDGLGERLPKQLSGGQAQRVALARGLFVQPRVLLLDEPFSAVDAFTRLKLQDLLLRVACAHGITVLLVTHDIAEAVRLADRVVVLEAGPGRIRAEVEVALPHPRDALASAGAIADVHQALQAATTPSAADAGEGAEPLTPAQGSSFMPSLLSTPRPGCRATLLLGLALKLIEGSFSGSLVPAF